MNEIEQLRIFVAIAESGSMTRAANRLQVAVSVVSRRFKELETRLGVQLAQRTTRRMSLTETGKQFYKDTRRILEELEQAEQAASRASAELTGTLRISAPLSFGIPHLMPTVSEYMRQNPALRVVLDMSDRRVDLIEEGFDLAIRLGNPEDSSLMGRRLATFKHWVCASPELLTQIELPKTPDDLQNFPTLTYSYLRPLNLWRYQAPDGSCGDIKVDPRLTVSNGDALCEAAVAGLGVICEPDFIVHHQIKNGALMPILTDYNWFGMEIHALYPPTRQLPKKVRVLIDMLVEKFGEQPYWGVQT